MLPSTSTFITYIPHDYLIPRKLFQSTVRPRGTRPHGTQTSLVHDFKKGSKNFEISDFGIKTSRDTILKVFKIF